MKNEEIIDEVLVTLMRAPKSYTAEDVVEINCHGGMTVLRAVLQAVLDAGARLADAGRIYQAGVSSWPHGFGPGRSSDRYYPCQDRKFFAPEPIIN